MEEFQGKTKNASVIGAMGEDIAANQFRARFHAAGDSFEVISNEGHEMDITGSMNISSDLGPHLEEVRLEIKQYTKAVPSGEVQKFWDDLQEGAASYGMMVSMKTPITGKPHFSLERVEEENWPFSLRTRTTNKNATSWLGNCCVISSNPILSQDRSARA